MLASSKDILSGKLFSLLLSKFIYCSKFVILYSAILNNTKFLKIFVDKPVFLLNTLINFILSFSFNISASLGKISVERNILYEVESLNFNDFKFCKESFKDVLNVSLSATGSRLIGSISYFLEPIILTFILTSIGYSNDYIVFEYGVIGGYVFPLLLIPSFFTMAISTSLLPVISNNYARGNYNYTKRKLKQAISFSLGIGIFFTMIFMIFPKELLHFIYNTNFGDNYVKFVAPFFLLHYIQGPLTSYMQAVNQAKEAMIGTLVGAIIKNLLLLILPIFIGIWGFVIASIVNIIYVTIQHVYYVKKSFNRD